MPGILDPTANSRSNIEAFIASIEDEAMRKLLLGHLDEILAIGQAGGINSATEESQKIYESLKELVDDEDAKES